MVILVPFLLITAVFSRMAILELNLPDKPGEGDAPPRLQLELVVEPGAVEVRDAAAGTLKRFAGRGAALDWEGLGALLLRLKERFPDERGALLRVAPEVDYQTLVRVMDRVRSATVMRNLEAVEVVLFPELALADPLLAEAKP
jgi:biopolymer transport protein ExbD